jgi:hypothetical protein
MNTDLTSSRLVVIVILGREPTIPLKQRCQADDASVWVVEVRFDPSDSCPCLNLTTASTSTPSIVCVIVVQSTQTITTMEQLGIDIQKEVCKGHTSREAAL